MKTLLLSALFLTAIVATAQLFTNNVSVVYSQEQRDIIQAANDLDNNLRTNGFAPYTAPTNALTLLQYFSQQAGVSLKNQAEEDYPKREAELLAAFRAAPLAKRMAAMKAAWAALQ